MQASLIHTANEVVECSGKIIRRYFRQPISVSNKEDMSPVTIADQKTEMAMRAIILENFPQHSIIGEEGENTVGSEPYTWIIDPIDGTKSFISGSPLFGTLVCLCKEETPQLGIIDIPISKERWVGIKNEATRYNKEVCQVSTTTQLNQAQLYCTEPNMFNVQQSQRFQALEKSVRLRRFGGDCYSYGMLASGYIDLVVDANLSPHDWMALIPVIEGAGGIITDWQGNTLDNNSDGAVIAASTHELHAQALKVLNDK